tara:strand:- start:20429 stop:20572 length:144 start_codon:yes stop_codon:yes gene_type:complete
MYGSGKDYMFEVYRSNEMVVEIPDIFVYTLAIGLALFIFKLSVKERK